MILEEKNKLKGICSMNQMPLFFHIFNIDASIFTEIIEIIDYRSANILSNRTLHNLPNKLNQ